MKKLLILGSGDLAQLIAYHAQNNSNYIVIGFLDDFKIKDTLEMGLPVIGNLKDAKELFNAKVFD
jgi:FlaA1/EpsC-like NDP-sugar epimerase